MASKHLVVRGRVQGVSFRASACERAGELGVVGWVRNRGDGSVEMVVEGDDEAVASMVTWANEGPPHAAVEAVDVTDTEPTGRRDFVQA